MKAEEFDRKFDAGEDMSEFFDLSRARHPNREKQKIELKLPLWIIRQLETEAQKQDVLSILKSLGINEADEKNIFEVWNKMDLLDEEKRTLLENSSLRQENVALVFRIKRAGMFKFTR